MKTDQEVDLTRVEQHRFERKSGTSTLQVQLQSLIARATDAGIFSILASLDLSSAFYLANIAVTKKTKEHWPSE